MPNEESNTLVVYKVMHNTMTIRIDMKMLFLAMRLLLAAVDSVWGILGALYLVFDVSYGVEDVVEEGGFS